MRKSFLRIVAVAPLLLATPAFAASAGRLTLVDVFSNAAGPIKLIALLLLTATVVAPVLLAIRRPEPLSALAKGAPLLGGAAVLFTLLAAAVGIANSPQVPSLTVLAPGFAEMLMLLVLSALATFSAVVCRELAKPRSHTFAAAE